MVIDTLEVNIASADGVVESTKVEIDQGAIQVVSKSLVGDSGPLQVVIGSQL